MKVDLRFVLKQIANGKYRVTLHGQKRMIERSVTHADIRKCAKEGNAIWAQEKIRIRGRDIDGYDLTLICVYADEVLIITVF